MNLAHWKNVLIVNTKLCLIDVFSNRTRSIITSLGIFLGVASLLANLSFIRAMDDDLKNNLEMIGGLNIITVRDVEPSNKQESIAFAKSKGLTVEEVEDAVKDMRLVDAVLPVADLHWNSFKAGGREKWARLTAVGYAHGKAYNYKIDQGRWFSQEEFGQREQVCIIGAQIAENLFGKWRNPTGRKITIRSIPFRVIGTIKSESMYEQRAMECLIPYPVYTARITGAHVHIENIGLLLKDSKYAEEAQLDLTNRLLTRHRGVENFIVEVNKDKIEEKKTAALGMKIVLWSIAVISLLVGGISIMNIMFATIGDRIREIGIRKALGAQKHDIFMQFIIEAIAVCFVGGIPGMLLGAAVTLFPRGIFPFYPHLMLIDYSMAFFFTIIAGLLSGLFPALKAANMQPVEALQY